MLTEKQRMNLLLHADDMEVSGQQDDAKALRYLLAAHSAGAQEPVAWAVYNGACQIALYDDKDAAESDSAEMQKTHDLSGSLSAFHIVPLYAHPHTMPQPVYDKSVVRRLATQWGMIPETGAARDVKRMDWLCHHAVNVRDPLPLGGSNDMFWASPYGDDTPSNLRTKIDAEIERIEGAKDQ